MRDATIDRLSKLITDKPHDNNNSDNNGTRPRRPAFELHIGLAEGWFSLVLLAVVVYSTIWCVQAVGWVDHLNILTLTTACGLITGVLAAKQRRFPRLMTHVVVLAFGLLLAFWQTSGAFYHGDTAAFVQGIHRWLTVLFSTGSSDDDSIFLFFIVALGFVLAYTSAWLVYRTRNPWLMILANAVVLLINLSNVDGGFVIFLTVFLTAALLLLLRFNLYESVQRWKRQGLRYADDIGWDVMQAGSMISIGILLFSWFLPWGYLDPNVSQIWNASSNPWVQLQSTWNRVISISGGTNPSNHGNFRDNLVLAGNPNLNHDLVLTIQTDDDGLQYLMSLNYDTYTGISGWTNTPTGNIPIKSNNALLTDASATSHLVKQQITIASPPGEQKSYILGASSIAAVNANANVTESTTSGATIAWLSQNWNLNPGTHYTVTSYVSSADENTLRSVPLPKDSPSFPSAYDGPQPPTVYNLNVAKANLQLPTALDPQIHQLALKITANAPTMYDKAVALETYLRTNYAYSVDIHRPINEEGVSWFLFRSGNQGFCNYFSSAMTVMARSLGIPAREAVGYTNGSYDSKNHRHAIYGTDAHSWTQVYFAGYGWINFEPSAHFAPFTRPLPNQFNTSSGSLGSNLGGSTVPSNVRNGRLNDINGPDAGGGTPISAAQSQLQLRQQIGFALGGLVLLFLFACLLFGIWWSRLFRHYGLSTQLYGRLSVMANWAGIELRPSQTPFEYTQELALVTPDSASTLERFSDIYVRDRWADPNSSEHPRHTGEMDELPRLWRQIQPRLALYVLRHPYFLRWLPVRLWHTIQTLWQRQRARRRFHNDL